MAEQVWLEHSDLADIANLWDISDEHFDYAFAKYAAENSSAARFACIYERDSGKCVSGKDNVLVNVENLNEEKFYLYTKSN